MASWLCQIIGKRRVDMRMALQKAVVRKEISTVYNIIKHKCLTKYSLLVWSCPPPPPLYLQDDVIYLHGSQECSVNITISVTHCNSLKEKLTTAERPNSVLELSESLWKAECERLQEKLKKATVQC